MGESNPHGLPLRCPHCAHPVSPQPTHDGAMVRCAGCGTEWDHDGDAAEASDASPIDLLIAQELEDRAADFASRATHHYPETVFPSPTLGATSSPDCYSAAGYRNAYRLVARDLRERAGELRETAEPS